MPKLEWLLFDLDNTLLDFSKASRNSFWKTMADHGFECDEEVYKIYKKVNDKVWTLLEEKKITALELRSKRFLDFFQEMNISGPDPSDFNAAYLTNLVEVSEMYEGVLEMLIELKTRYRMSIVTNGLSEVQEPRMSRLNLMPLFDSIIVSDDIGVAKPDPGFFEYTFQTIENAPPKETVMIIGDNLNSDILGGLQFGIQTCWLHHGRPNDTGIEPHFQIEKIDALPNLLTSLA